MKHLFIILTFSILFASCSKEKDQNKQICILADPINELPWLKEIKNSLTNCSCQISILQAIYDEQTVFYSAMNDPLCNSVQTYTLYNCDGKVVEVITSDKMQNFQAKVSEIKNLYQCKN